MVIAASRTAIVIGRLIPFSKFQDIARDHVLGVYALPKHTLPLVFRLTVAYTSHVTAKVENIFRVKSWRFSASVTA